MTFPKLFGLVLVLLSQVACSKLPLQTSLGELYRMKKVQSVNTNTKDAKTPMLKGPETISANRGETLVLLYFRGKKDIELKHPSELPDNICRKERSVYLPLGMVPCLEDSSGRQFRPVFEGTDTADGTLSTKGWVYDCNLTDSGWGYVAFGTLRTPDPHFVSVYLVPRDAKGLKLQDLGQALALE